jgi:hypothetical protein
LYRRISWYATTNDVNGLSDKTGRNCSGTCLLVYTMGERKNQKIRR